MAHKRLVTRTPQTWLGIIAEAAFGTAGRSVIIDGAWYRFRRGRGLVCSSADVAASRAELCVVDAGPTEDDLGHLVGTRWSTLTNCATVFAPFWRSDVSGVSTGDRQSIVRSVLLGLIVAAALAVSAGYFVNSWIDGKLDTMQRSNAAHFGQIKAMIKDMSREN